MDSSGVGSALLFNINWCCLFLDPDHSHRRHEQRPVHSGFEGTDSLSRESDQKLAALYCKTNRKLPFLKAAKGCFENSMK